MTIGAKTSSASGFTEIETQVNMTTAAIRYAGINQRVSALRRLAWANSARLGQPGIGQSHKQKFQQQRREEHQPLFWNSLSKKKRSKRK